ncbi:hypothetical protein F4809DRAFT_607548 [Biscogniauxia mediterranea]|nr:hypothetical protein F4809DRAFT_607548 [Biscogniauxia mediterranea]
MPSNCYCCSCCCGYSCCCSDYGSCASSPSYASCPCPCPSSPCVPCPSCARPRQAQTAGIPRLRRGCFHHHDRPYSAPQPRLRWRPVDCRPSYRPLGHRASTRGPGHLQRRAAAAAAAAADSAGRPGMGHHAAAVGEVGGTGSNDPGSSSRSLAEGAGCGRTQADRPGTTPAVDGREYTAGLLAAADTGAAVRRRAGAEGIVAAAAPVEDTGAAAGIDSGEEGIHHRRHRNSRDSTCY